MKKISKLLSLVLTFCILASCMTFTAFADSAVTYLDLSATKTIYKTGESETIKIYSTEYVTSTETAEDGTETTVITPNSTLLSNSDFTFTSSNTVAFEVSSEGVLTAKNEGRSVITVTNGTLTNNFIATCYETEIGVTEGAVWVDYYRKDDPAGIEARRVCGGGDLTINNQAIDDRIITMWFYDADGTMVSQNNRLAYYNNYWYNFNLNANNYTVGYCFGNNDTDYTPETVARSKGWHQLTLLQEKATDTTVTTRWFIDGKLVYKVTGDIFVTRFAPLANINLYGAECVVYTENTIPVGTKTLKSLDISETVTSFPLDGGKIENVYAVYDVTTPAYTDADGVEHEEIVTEEKELIPAEDLDIDIYDTSVLSVAKDGTVTAKKAGGTTATISYEDISLNVVFKVYTAEFSGLDLSGMTTNLQLSSGSTDISGIRSILKTTVPEWTYEDPETYEEITAPETVSTLKAEVNISDISFSVSDSDILEVSDGKLIPKKTGYTKLTATYNGASSTCLISVYDSGLTAYNFNSPTKEFDGRTVHTTGIFVNNGGSYTKEKNYTYSLWFYDDGVGSALNTISMNVPITNMNLKASASSLYYQLHGLDSAYLKYEAVDVERTSGWHQLFVTVEGGTDYDNIDSIKATAYIDGKVVYIYESAAPETYQLWTVNATAVTYAPAITSYTPNAAVVSTLPANNAKDVPLYTAFSINFEGKATDYENAFTIKDGDGKEVSYKAILSTNGKKVTLDAGKLSADTQYTVEMNGVKVNDTSLSGTYTFKTRAAEDNYLESTLDAMQGNYELVYQRAADFSDSSKTIEEYGLHMTSVSLDYERADGLTVSVGNGMASFDYEADALKAGYLSFSNVGSGVVYDATNKQVLEQDPDVTVVKYKYRLRVDEIPVSGEGTEEEIAAEAAAAYELEKDIRRDMMTLTGSINSYTIGNASSANYVNTVDTLVSRTINRDAVTEANQIQVTTPDGYAWNSVGNASLTDNENWVDVTYIIERNSHEYGAEGAVTYTIKLEDETLYKATLKDANYGLRSIYHTIGGGTYATAEYATGIDIADYQVYGYNKKDSYSALTAYEKDAEGNKTAVVTNNMAGKTLYASLSAMSASDKTASVIFALFDKSTNKLVSCSIKPASLVANVSQDIESDAFTVPTDEGKAYEIKAFVWVTDETGSNTMTPVFYAPSYVNEEIAE